MDAAAVARRVGRAVAGGDPAERTAALVSTVSTGMTFMPGLLPRDGADQAAATGLVSAAEYGLVVTSQSASEAIARRLVHDDGTPGAAARRLAVQAGVGLALASAGAAVERIATPRHGEPLRRALVRTVGRRTARVGLSGVVVSTLAAADAAIGGRHRVLRQASGSAALVVGTALAAWQIRRFRSDDPDEAARVAPPTDPVTGKMGGPGGAPPGDQGTAVAPPLPPLAKSLLIGVGVNVGLQSFAALEGRFARAVGARVRRVAPGAGWSAGALGHAVALGAIGAGVVAAVEYALRTAEAGGAAIDAAYTSPPTGSTVSGGPASAVEWSTLSREGVRFVNMALTADEIAAVTQADAGTVREPVRAFVGLASAATVDARVDLAMRELEDLGAFERSVICLVSPTGTGYINYVAIEALEYLTRGDCATVGLQYSLRPSFLSLDRVAMGREQNRALLHALTWRLRSMPEESRPRLVGFGESLGAHTLQDAFLHEGVPGLHRVGMDRALFVGTPAGSTWAQQWRLDPHGTDPDAEAVEVASWSQWAALDDTQRAAHRYFLLSHTEDPITVFSPALAIQQPDWLGPVDQRPPGVSKLAHWYPLVSFVLTLVDVTNALSAVPGIFVARGHDYRADLAQLVSAAYALDVEDTELARIEAALREREALWAERRLVAEQMHRAREAVQRQLDQWGTGSQGADTLAGQGYVERATGIEPA
ncbi:alpha/beta-hydrolase family protein [Cellulomonas edaphi]|uniref:Alpha/beta-hydrolase family protein n=1 Tax=Cellulomonas edaphi TaxID=3053468 RepID=A0ABT7SAK3_9CELL|nr:alpha/beta-hydrolase family protein [Cellulomons edaphi]MDM7832646.1 alpha/beta-hydrolase family protein [Cellulomons edaphi]